MPDAAEAARQAHPDPRVSRKAASRWLERRRDAVHGALRTLKGGICGSAARLRADRVWRAKPLRPVGHPRVAVHPVCRAGADGAGAARRSGHEMVKCQRCENLTSEPPTIDGPGSSGASPPSKHRNQCFEVKRIGQTPGTKPNPASGRMRRAPPAGFRRTVSCVQQLPSSTIQGPIQRFWTSVGNSVPHRLD